jgi:hypothetical protein
MDIESFAQDLESDGGSVANGRIFPRQALDPRQLPT